LDRYGLDPVGRALVDRDDDPAHALPPERRRHDRALPHPVLDLVGECPRDGARRHERIDRRVGHGYAFPLWAWASSAAFACLRLFQLRVRAIMNSATSPQTRLATTIATFMPTLNASSSEGLTASPWKRNTISPCFVPAPPGVAGKSVASES